jgi:hypothetical protein
VTARVVDTFAASQSAYFNSGVVGTVTGRATAGRTGAVALTGGVVLGLGVATGAGAGLGEGRATGVLDDAAGEGVIVESRREETEEAGRAVSCGCCCSLAAAGVCAGWGDGPPRRARRFRRIFVVSQCLRLYSPKDDTYLLGVAQILVVAGHSL